MSSPTLPDYLRPGLDIVFVGINPGAYSASVGKYFATPQNRFWPALNRSGIVGAGRDLGPGDEAWLSDRGLGFTDVVKRASNSASSLRAADFRKWAPVAKAKLVEAAPLVVCFNGVTGFKWFMQYAEAVKVDVELGRQPGLLGTSRVFVAPNPSPANAVYSLDAIAGWYRRLGELRDELKRG
ncbi:MAG: mismatch-specific DNA-glycosylase [Chloroflexi bacterium]|nr:mismatch-specific DNA-glycosylase [Chloroflexota bacterium]